ncbi:MAG: tRNA (adenosine(37)-N6)-threonylcarbamoyltransferase complex transferase subunit TsaD [Alphaproteobacteria bacterium]|nr:tRNA (adenosine(37)-N6)-threonylcarbamoyltransferase complex transferase subunit TsaD [Alphaproteobacteria bacterium]
MVVLGLETSCDETSVGIVDAGRRIRAHVLVSQLAEHKPYGGVVPEIAARAHLDHLDGMVERALDEAGLRLKDMSGIAATSGPGLIGGVMVGAMTGKAIAAVRGLPFIAVNHLEAHALSPRLSDNVEFPYLLLLVSGGHCQLLLVRGVGDYRCLGSTIDDAAGECFDKGAKLLGLGYPGGPLIERAAAKGNPKAFDLPRPLTGRAGCDFSFSGLKTALRQLVHAEKPGDAFVADAAASLQAAIADILADRTQNALELLQEEGEKITALVAAGGVAANQAIRGRLTALAARHGLSFIAPPMELCTDNGAMVAWAGLERLRLGLTDGLDTAARPRWPLDEKREPALANKRRTG